MYALNMADMVFIQIKQVLDLMSAVKKKVHGRKSGPNKIFSIFLSKFNNFGPINTLKLPWPGEKQESLHLNIFSVQGRIEKYNSGLLNTFKCILIQHKNESFKQLRRRVFGMDGIF